MGFRWSNGYVPALPVAASENLRSSTVLLFGILFLGIFLFDNLCIPVFAVNNYLPGLRSGDSAYYSLSGNYGFNQPVTRMVVSNVAGTNVTASFTSLFLDGYTPSGLFWVDVFTGQLYNGSSNFLFTVATGLQRTDSVFHGSVLTITVGPRSVACGGVSRQVVSTQFSRLSQAVSISWDQSTGAMCSYSAYDDNGRALTLQMTNTTLWSSSSTSSPDSLTVVAEVGAAFGGVLVVLIVFVYFRGKPTKKPQRSR